MDNQALTQDAGNRALRTALQALGTEVLIQVVPALLALVQDETIEWDIQVVTSLVRIAVIAGLSFLMRRVLDPSRIPTPLPPAVVTPPVTPDPAP